MQMRVFSSVLNHPEPLANTLPYRQFACAFFDSGHGPQYTRVLLSYMGWCLHFIYTFGICSFVYISSLVPRAIFLIPIS